MKKLLIFFVLALIGFTVSIPTEAKESAKPTDTIIKNRLFSLSIPYELKGEYTYKTQKDRICIYHKESKKAGFGGFAFGIKAYKNPADHAEMPGARKIGELTDRKGNLYDMVLKHPTDVQYDYTKNSGVPKPFAKLYDLGETIDIKGVMLKAQRITKIRE